MHDIRVRQIKTGECGGVCFPTCNGDYRWPVVAKAEQTVLPDNGEPIYVSNTLEKYNYTYHNAFALG